jgi:D-apionolactonase
LSREDPTLLHAGSFSAELVGADLRLIRFCDVEVVRRITVAVRDPEWGTAPATVEHISVTAEERSFSVEATVLHEQDEIAFRHSLVVAGSADEAIVYRIEGRSLGSFEASRVGICVLHPPATCAGRPYRVEQWDGSVVDGRFPDTILPQMLLASGEDRPPIASIRRLVLEPGGDRELSFAFDGAPFSLEDQRNWGDASYKSCTEDPPELPFLLDPSHVVAQGVTVSVSAARRQHAPQARRPVVSVGEPASALPPIGIAGPGVGSEDLLDAVHPSFVHVSARAPDDLRAARRARVLVELEVPSTDGAAGTAAEIVGSLLERVVVVDPGAPVPRADAVAAFGERFGVPAGAGSPGGFVGLTTYGLDPSTSSLLWWAVCSQVHANDDRSIMENATPLGAMVTSARAIASRAQTSVTLRFAHMGTSDARAWRALGQAWLAGSIAGLALAGADAISVAATSLRDGDTPSSAILRLFAERRGATVLSTAVTDELAVAALGLERDRRRELLLVNLRSFATEVEIEGGRRRRQALAPYEVALVDLGRVPVWGIP